jgi:hypothetical protein
MKLDEFCTCNNHVNLGGKSIDNNTYLYRSTYSTQAPLPPPPPPQNRPAFNDYNAILANFNSGVKSQRGVIVNYEPPLPPPPPALTAATATAPKSYFNQQVQHLHQPNKPTLASQAKLYSYTPTKQSTVTTAAQFLHHHNQPNPAHNIYHQVEDDEDESAGGCSSAPDEQLLIKINAAPARQSSQQQTEPQVRSTCNKGITNEETRRLSGLVAKNRALFEAAAVTSSNPANTNKQAKSTGNRSSINKSISVNYLNSNNNINTRSSNTNSFPNNGKTSGDFSDESTTTNHSHINNSNSNMSASYSNQQASLPQLPQSYHFKPPACDSEAAVVATVSRPLWSRGELAEGSSSSSSSSSSSEIDVPRSVKEARACFENLAVSNGSYSLLSKSQMQLSQQRGASKVTAQPTTNLVGFYHFPVFFRTHFLAVLKLHTEIELFTNTVFFVFLSLKMHNLNFL